MKTFSIGALLLGACLYGSSSYASEDCGALYESHLKTDLALSYEKFDQTPSEGFRALADQGCDKRLLI